MPTWGVLILCCGALSIDYTTQKIPNMFTVILATLAFEYGIAAVIGIAFLSYFCFLEYRDKQKLKKEVSSFKLPRHVPSECLKLYRELFPDDTLDACREAELCALIWVVVMRSLIEFAPKTKILKYPLTYESARSYVCISLSVNYKGLYDKPSQVFDCRYEKYRWSLSELMREPMCREVVLMRLSQFCALSTRNEKLFVGTDFELEAVDDCLEENQKYDYYMRKKAYRRWFDLCLERILDADGMVDMLILMAITEENGIWRVRE